MSAATVYSLRLRPVSMFTLPDGLTWEFVALPWGSIRTDLPESRRRYGEFTTSRPLTPEELEHFDVEVVR